VHSNLSLSVCLHGYSLRWSDESENDLITYIVCLYNPIDILFLEFALTIKIIFAEIKMDEIL